MSDRKTDYSYASNANLVLQADRNMITKRHNEPTGEAQSLAGRIKKSDFGSRAGNTIKLQVQSKPKIERVVGTGGLSIYKPLTRQTLEAWQLILGFLGRSLGDVDQETLHSCGDEVLNILKGDGKDLDKLKVVEGIIGPIGAEEFAQLTVLGNKITDFVGQGDDGDGAELNDEGVAVLFDEEVEEEVEEVVSDQESEDDPVLNEANLSNEAVIQSKDLGNDDGADGVLDRQLKSGDVDAFWLQRAVSRYYPDAITSQSKSIAAQRLLESKDNIRDCENELMELFDYEHFELVKTLLKDRDLIAWSTKLAKAQDSERMEIEQEIRARNLGWIIDQSVGAGTADLEIGKVVIEDVAMDTLTSESQPRQQVDLEALAFEQGGHFMSNKKVRLPEGSFKKSKKGYEEVHIPAPTQQPFADGEKLRSISTLPQWSREAFSNSKSLNRIQSKVYPIAFNSDENILLCAPTGAGKTNCAMLTILREIGKYRTDNGIDLDSFKIVYVAPMKALVSEMVGNFQTRLASYGITVAELTGDRQLTKKQIAETQIIVTTPEKWDIITRKATDRSYTRLVRLIIVDEIHLLHDSRGPVLEAIISRTIRQIEQTQEMIRLVGLSATLPNYKDVASFMRVGEKGLFFFDNSYRPCPLKQQYIGITEKKAIKRLALMNEIVYDKIIEELGKNRDNQILVFCHSRKETSKTAKAVRDLAIERDTIGQILSTDAASREILQSESEVVKNDDLKELLPYGFAIHHAGMTRSDRTLVEELYADRHIPVLVSTATLAWGVNLPAHTVIIKGTQVYNPELGRWAELSPQDMFQMLGRAGRPQFDTFGEGVIITTHQELQYYLSLLNEQLPIESQLISKLPDVLNAEIVMGNILNRQDAVNWLGYTYLYVRMLRNGSLYGVTYEDAEDDPYLLQKRIDYIHAAANVLDKSNLIRYDRKTGKIQSTEIGRIASYYYISHQSMSTYNQHLKPSMTLIDLFRVFALSDEFRLLPVRQEEKIELAKMIERVPIPVKEGIDEPAAKVNVLLQSYISQLKLEGFALMSDMVYVTQSAGRILRAIFEICLKRGWAQLSRKALDICKMVDKRAWMSMSPLRQFQNFPSELIRKLERKDIPWDRYFDFTQQELGELVGSPKSGSMVHKFIHHFPRLDLVPYVQPITRSMLKIELDITPNFVFDTEIHGGVESFWVLVEDVDAEIILYHDIFVLKSRYANDEHTISFTVPLYEPLPPNYFISIVSDRWLHVETRVPILLKNLILPEKYPTHTELLDLQPLPVSAFRNVEIESIYEGIYEFNSIQTQVFNSVFSGDDNVLICAPVGSGKTVCAEFALFKLWSQSSKGRCVYICPMKEVIESKLNDWKTKFGSYMGGKEIVCLSGETSTDLKLLETSDIIFATPEQWDWISRRWKQRKNVSSIELFIMDDIHLIGGDLGPTIEIILSRMRFISAQTGSKNRIIALGASLANARDIGEWIGATSASTFNFHPSVRPVPLEIHIQGFNIPHFASLMLAMSKPTYSSISLLAKQEPSIVFVPSRKQSRATATELLTYSVAESDKKRFLHCTEKDLEPYLDKIHDSNLTTAIKHGIAYYHAGMSMNDKKIISSLFNKGFIQIVVVSRDSCWGFQLKARLVVIMGSQYFEGREHRYVDYPVTDILQMMSYASRRNKGEIGQAVLMCTSIKKEFYKKFLHDALPVESHLNHFLHDHFNAEIVTKTIENKQDAVDYLTWTFLYRRMALNPNFYDLQGSSHRHLSDHLSQLVEQTLEDLEENKCIVIEDESVAALNLGMIASFYYINYRTIQTFSVSLKSKTRLQLLLDIITSAVEYETLPIRHHEDSILSKIYDKLPRKTVNPNFNDPHFKANVLLQAHFSRFVLPPDLESDQKLVLDRVIRLLQACVDVISSNGWLAPALAAMELSQMCVQAIWDKDSALLQIPHFTNDIIKRLGAHDVEDVGDLMDLDPKLREECLRLDKFQLRDVIKFVNQFPSIEVELGIETKDVEQGSNAKLFVSLEREGEEEMKSVTSPYFPSQKEEGWWVIIGDSKTKSLLAIKRITIAQKLKLELGFVVPYVDVGTYELKLYLMCDSYMGVDQEFEFEMNVLKGSDEQMLE